MLQRTSIERKILTQSVQDRLLVKLTLSQKISRIYGMWWDVLNTSIAVLLLFILFVGTSFLMITDRLELAPFYSSIWAPFETAVSLSRRAELGLSILSVSVSGASAAALYLISQGTRRWAVNRRIGLFHLYCAEECHAELAAEQLDQGRVHRSLEALIDGSSSYFDDINLLHPHAQIAYEALRARVLSSRGAEVTADELEAVICDLLFVALLCLGKIEPRCNADNLQNWLADFSVLQPAHRVTSPHQSAGSRFYHNKQSMLQVEREKES